MEIDGEKGRVCVIKIQILFNDFEEKFEGKVKENFTGWYFKLKFLIQC